MLRIYGRTRLHWALLCTLGQLCLLSVIVGPLLMTGAMPTNNGSSGFGPGLFMTLLGALVLLPVCVMSVFHILQRWKPIITCEQDIIVFREIGKPGKAPTTLGLLLHASPLKPLFLLIDSLRLLVAIATGQAFQTRVLALPIEAITAISLQPKGLTPTLTFHFEIFDEDGGCQSGFKVYTQDDLAKPLKKVMKRLQSHFQQHAPGPPPHTEPLADPPCHSADMVTPPSDVTA